MQLCSYQHCDYIAQVSCTSAVATSKETLSIFLPDRSSVNLKGLFYCSQRMCSSWCGLVPRSESGATMRRLHLPLRCLKSCSAACVPFLNQYATTSSPSSSSFVLFQPLRPQAVSPTPPQGFYSYQMNVEHSQHSIPLLLDN